LILRLRRLFGFFYYRLIFAQEGLLFIVVPRFSINNPIVRKHPIHNVRYSNAVTNGLYIFDSILAKEAFKDASNEIDHDPVPLLSQQCRKLGKLEHPFLVNYQR
jgi:hypothetical protein